MRLRGKAGALELEQLLDSGPWRLRRTATASQGKAGCARRVQKQAGLRARRASEREHVGTGERACARAAAKHAQLKTTEIVGAPRVRERLNRSSAYGDLLTTGRSREEVGYTSLPKDKNTATESSLRRRGRALNLARLRAREVGEEEDDGEEDPEAVEVRASK